MPNPYNAPEVTVHEVKRRLAANETFVLLDVREPYELVRAALAYPQVEVAPLSRLSTYQVEGLPAAAQDQQAAIVVFCHHGVRSAQVTMWLRQQGWTDVTSMAGGIDAWAKEIDASSWVLLSKLPANFYKNFHNNLAVPPSVLECPSSLSALPVCMSLPWANSQPARGGI